MDKVRALNSRARSTWCNKPALLVLAVSLLVVALAIFAPAPSTAWATQDLAAGSLGQQGSVLVSTQDDFSYLGDDDEVCVVNRTHGTADYDSATKTLTLNGIAGDDLKIYPKGQNITLVLNGENEFLTVLSHANLTVKGSGSLIVAEKMEAYDNNYSITITKGTIEGPISAKSVTVKGGTIEGPISAKSVTVKGGTIKGLGNGAKIVAAKGNFTMTGGTVTLSTPMDVGISAANGAFKVSGGKLTIANAKKDAVSAKTAAITGGSLSIKVANAKSNYAIAATKMSNKLGCFKVLSGRLSYGAQFKVGKNLYKVMRNSSRVQLVKYNATAKRPSLFRAKYGNYAYEISGVASNAFNTKTGAKVKSIVLKGDITMLGKYAFRNTKALTLLAFNYAHFAEPVFDANYDLVSVKTRSGYSINKRALAKAGKANGKKLTVRLGEHGVYSEEAPQYVKYLRSRGLSKYAKVQTY